MPRKYTKRAPATSDQEKNPDLKENPARLKSKGSVQSGARLTPHQVANMRAGLYRKVEAQIGDAHEVVMGRKNWSPTQARVFSTMLNKVMPDLTANFVQHEHVTTDDPTKLSRADLERIVAEAEGIAATPSEDDEDNTIEGEVLNSTTNPQD